MTSGRSRVFSVAVATISALAALLLADLAFNARAPGRAVRAQSTDGRVARDSVPWNVVFILADDMGWNQTGYGWNRAGYPGVGYYQTPNIDRIAAEGIHFTNAYAAAPICSPTRAGLMTGKHPARVHLTDYIPGSPYPYAAVTTPQQEKALPLEEVTIPEMLKAAGYVSGHFGKWHLGIDYNYQPGRPFDPASQGFDEVFTAVKPEEEADPAADPHSADAITERSIAFLEAHQERPFFLYVAHNIVHRPLHATPERTKKYEDKAGSLLAENSPVMGAMIEQMDEGIGRILDKLDELGLTERTVVVFYSDNGGLEMLQDQEPLRGGKAMLWEGGIRVPLAIRWPGVVAPGTSSDEPVNSEDFFLTIAELAGIAPDVPDLDGVSLVPLLRGTGEIKRDALYWHYPHYHHLGFKPSGAIREGDFKLIEWYEESLTGAEAPVSLYNLREDIGEIHDLADEMPEKVADLKEKLKRWRERVGAQEMAVNPDHDPARAHWRQTDSEDGD